HVLQNGDVYEGWPRAALLYTRPGAVTRKSLTDRAAKDLLRLNRRRYSQIRNRIGLALCRCHSCEHPDSTTSAMLPPFFGTCASEEVLDRIVPLVTLDAVH